MEKVNKKIEEAARNLYIDFGFKFYKVDRLNHAVAKELWDKGKCSIEGGENPDSFTCTEATKQVWYDKAKKMIGWFDGREKEYDKIQ